MRLGKNAFFFLLLSGFSQNLDNFIPFASNMQVTLESCICIVSREAK